MNSSLKRNAVPVIVATAAFALLASAMTCAPSAAARVLVAWGVEPFRFPFVDLDTILSALRCRRLGVDVFSVNPCDALGRVFDYSPLWLAGAVFPVTTDWIVPGGLAVDAAFLASLWLLPPGRGRWQAVIVTACVLSTPVAFAMERANNDLVIFVLAAGAAALTQRSLAVRMVGYGCALLAGLLKYYPLLVLVLLCRERARVCVPVVVACGLGLILFVALEFQELGRALPLIPVGRYFGDMFGARTLPFGAADALGLSPLSARLAMVGLVVSSLTVAVTAGAHARVQVDLDRLTERERVFLLTGAMLILGCFFTAQNIGYRSLHLLMTVPALTALATVGRYRQFYRLSAAVMLVLLWSEGWRHGVDALLQLRPPWADLPRPVDGFAWLLGWLVRELCWWWTVTLLAGLSFGVVLRSPVGRAALPRLAGRACLSRAPLGAMV